jgi:hypothetical protein
MHTFVPAPSWAKQRVTNFRVSPGSSTQAGLPKKSWRELNPRKGAYANDYEREHITELLSGGQLTVARF